MTVIVLVVVAALIGLANMTDDCRQRDNLQPSIVPADLTFDLRECIDRNHPAWGIWNMSYGWPLAWRQCVFAFTPGPSGMIGWRFSGYRLAGNLVMWLVMVVIPAGACEWVMRRNRPRFRFSVRTLLATIGLASAVCAWFATARHRASLQDPVITGGSRVWVQRWGPKWLEFVGADHLCRRVVGADLRRGHASPDEDEGVEETLERLRRLHSLEYLLVHVDRLTPAMAAAIGDMTLLRTLSIRFDVLTDEIGGNLARSLGSKGKLEVLNVEYDGVAGAEDATQIWHQCFVVIGNIESLKWLRIKGATAIKRRSLAGLKGLANLRSLSLDLGLSLDDTGERASHGHLEGLLPGLPRLEALTLEIRGLLDTDLHCVAALPRLKSLRLEDKSDLDLGALASTIQLEELSISRMMVSPAVLDALRGVNGLKSLHLGPNYGTPEPLVNIELDRGHVLCVPEASARALRLALEELRQSKPGIVIDCEKYATDFAEGHVTPSGYDAIPDQGRTAAHKFLREWEEGKGELQRAGWVE